MSDNVLQITDDNFDSEILKSETPALVDFWAAWCGPCRAIAPVVEELAESFAGKVKVGKCNVDENPRPLGSTASAPSPPLSFSRAAKLWTRSPARFPKATWKRPSTRSSNGFAIKILYGGP